MKKYKELQDDRYTGYESFCYRCRQQLLSEYPISCPKCGREDMKIHIWKDGDLQCGYAKLEREDSTKVQLIGYSEQYPKELPALTVKTLVSKQTEAIEGNKRDIKKLINVKRIGE